MPEQTEVVVFTCPNCDYQFPGDVTAETSCPACGTPMITVNSEEDEE